MRPHLRDTKRTALQVEVAILLDHVDRGDIVGWNKLALKKNLLGLDHLRLHPACLQGVCLAGASLKGAQFIDCDLQSADFTGADLTDANFVKSRLQGAEFVRCKALRARFDRVRLPAATFAHADLRQSSFVGALAPKSDFTEAELGGASFQGADLRGAVFQRAMLRGADLRLADLGAAVLVDANLEGSKLGGADVATATLDGVKLAATGYSVDDLRKSLNRHRVFDQNALPGTCVGCRDEPRRTHRSSPARRQPRLSSAGSMPEQAVIVEFKRGATDPGAFSELEDQITSAIQAAGAGELDGKEMATDGSSGSLYMYGPDADALFQAVWPVLKSAACIREVVARIRYGPPEEGVKEREVAIGPRPT